MGNTQRNGQNNRWKRMGETHSELPLGGFLSHLVTSFKAASYIAGFTLPRMTVEYA